MPTLETADGKTVALDADAVNAQFAAAMNDDKPAEQAPPKRTPKAKADPDAPAPRRGRPPKAEQARTATAAAAPVVKDSYAEEAQQLVGTVWTVAASIGVTAPYALVLEANGDALASALAEGAKHNETIRGFVSTGESSWVLGLASVSLAMGFQSWQLMRDPQLRAEAAATTRAHLKAAMSAKGIEIPESVDVATGA